MMQKGRLHVRLECTSDEFIALSRLPLPDHNTILEAISHAKRIETFSRNYDVKLFLCNSLTQEQEHHVGERR
jgi:hypothetical protein